MSLEAGRLNKEHALHELQIVVNLERASFRANNWRDQEAANHYRFSFVDTIIRVQAGDLNSVEMFYETDPSGYRKVRLKLPIVSPALRNFEMSLTKPLKELELAEPRIREVLPVTQEDRIRDTHMSQAHYRDIRGRWLAYQVPEGIYNNAKDSLKRNFLNILAGIKSGEIDRASLEISKSPIPSITEEGLTIALPAIEDGVRFPETRIFFTVRELEEIDPNVTALLPEAGA